MNNHMVAAFYGVRDYKAFCNDIQSAVNQVNDGGVYIGDNLFTFSRNLGFMDDKKFMAAFENNAQTDVEKAVMWRLHTLCWAAKRTTPIEGAMVECACYKGTSARIVAEYVELKDSDKEFYLYDLFDHDASMAHHDMPDHSATLFEQVKTRFSDMPNVVVTQGPVPQILERSPISLNRIFDFFESGYVIQDTGWEGGQPECQNPIHRICGIA